MRSRGVIVLASLALLLVVPTTCSLAGGGDGAEGSPSSEPPTAVARSQPGTETSPGGAVTPDLLVDAELLQGPPPPPGYRALVPGHNRLDADRINLVFDPDPDVGGDPESFDPLLSWDGVPRLRSSQVVFGVFAIEPFRSNRHLFNLWLADPMAIERDEFDSIPDGTFPDMVSIRMRSGEGRAAAEMSQFTTPPGAAPVGNVEFREVLDYRKGHIGSVTLYAADFALEGQTLTHELGHALFGLADEYYGESGEANPQFVSVGEWPNCAASRQQAEEWWGDLVGTYDPMIDIWIEESRRLGVDFSDSEIAGFHREGTVDLADGHRGCYDRDGFYRPTSQSLMGIDGEPPAFGPVSRRWAERILASYTGEVPKG